MVNSLKVSIIKLGIFLTDRMQTVWTVSNNFVEFVLVHIGDIFNIAVGGSSQSFEEYGATHTQDVRFRIDQNTDKPVGTFKGVNDEGKTLLDVSGIHNASLEFSVPEPATLAMLGLGLLGFGASRRKAK